MAPGNRVLGVIRPTAEYIGSQTRTGKVGILGTKGTVTSQSYLIEIRKFFPDVQVLQQACPLWVPLIENKEVHSRGLDFFVKKDVQALFAQQPDIDIVVMACTHYPLIHDTIIKYLPPHVRLVGQGPLVAERLKDYLIRHPEMEQRLTQNSTRTYLTTGDAGDFSRNGSFFLGEPFTAAPVILS